MIHFNYNLKRDDYKYFISEKNKQYNIIYFIIATILYCFFMFDLLIKKPIYISLLFVIYLITITIILKIRNIIFTYINVNNNDNNMLWPYSKYKVVVDDKGINITVLKNERTITWDQIKGVHITEKYIMLYTEYSDTIFFRKEYFKKKEKYEKLIFIINNKTKF
ncbi:MAG: YcxB family protein [Bacilli bacterium]|nr:YcxB family protein [Bacilli bacterium]MDD4607817.1 YcxB family protein [Bacilli bacterium]